MSPGFMDRSIVWGGVCRGDKNHRMVQRRLESWTVQREKGSWEVQREKESCWEAVCCSNYDTVTERAGVLPVTGGQKS